MSEEKTTVEQEAVADDDAVLDEQTKPPTPNKKNIKPKNKQQNKQTQKDPVTPMSE